MTARPQLDSRYEAPEPPLQLEKIFKFQQRLFGDMSGALGAMAASVGDRLGLLRAVAEQDDVSAAELASQQGLCPEMTADWLRVMTCAGYLEQAADPGRYRLPPEHAMVLANDAGPMCLAGALQQLGGFANELDHLVEAFRSGEGIAQPAYSPNLREGMERLSATWFEHELADQWIAALPEVADKLRAGGTVADCGCGGGRAVIRMARAFPASRFVGYDALPAAIERASRNAASAGVAERVSFEVRDIMKGMPAHYDLVTAFDSLHDLPDPLEGLVALARGLKRNATLLVLELGADSELMEAPGPIAVVHHATRLFYNLPVALASYGRAPRNKGFHEAELRSLCTKAGLMFQRSLPVRNPLHKLYVIKAPPF